MSDALAGLPEDAVEPLMAAVTAARWFAGKGRSASPRTFTALPWLNEAGAEPRVRLAVLEVAYAEGSGTEKPVEVSTRRRMGAGSADQ